MCNSKEIYHSNKIWKKQRMKFVFNKIGKKNCFVGARMVKFILVLLFLAHKTVSFSFSCIPNRNMNKIPYTVSNMVKDNHPYKENNKQIAKGQKNKKPKRRFAQKIDPSLISQSLPMSPNTVTGPNKKSMKTRQNHVEAPVIDVGMQNFMKMESDNWKKQMKGKKEDESNMMTMKEFMNEMVEKENRSPSTSYKKKVVDANDDRTPLYQQQQKMNQNFSPQNTKYKDNQSMDSNKKTSNKVPKSMMRTNMSIDDLEAVLMKRWGTNSEQFTADPREYESDDDENYYNKSSKQDDGIFFRGKAVIDPWEKEQRSKEKKKKRQKKVEEFYDEDDEGYEISGLKQKKNKYGDLIAPSSIGGVGSDTQSSSFFSRENTSNKVQTSDQPSSPIKNGESTPQKRERGKSSTTTNPNKPLRKRNPILLDKDGNEMYLTVDKALNDADMSLSSEVDGSDGKLAGHDEEIRDQTFESLGISHPNIISNLNKLSLYSPLPVQIQSIPPALSGKDVLLPTHTGSGKTLAFLLPILENLLSSRDLEDDNFQQGIKVIILVPGRELASQIMSVTRDMISGTGLKALLAIGGTPYKRSVDMLRKNKPDIIVGTPGRLAELIVGRPGDKSGKMKLHTIKTIVLDEFDALLQYKPHREPTSATIDHLHRYTSRNIQTFLCSATASDIPSETLENYLRRDYVSASTSFDGSTKLVTTSGMSKTVIHGVIHVPHQKMALETLRKVLHTDPAPRQILIFVENARRVDIIVDKLAEMNIIAAPLHGGTGQGNNQASKTDRSEVNKALRDGYVGIVVATELAARGIDAPLLTHVINLDLPTDASHYAHRAGRCGRGIGRPGVVLNFTTNNKERNVPKNKFAEKLGIKMYTVEPRRGKLAILNEEELEQVQQI